MSFPYKRAEKARKVYDLILNLDSAGIVVVDERLLIETLAEHHRLPISALDSDDCGDDNNRYEVYRKFREEMQRE